jgi:uncharacterized membrane protein YecN with MAPEG domain
VGRVPVPVVHVVGVTLVRDRYVAAVRAVLVGVALVSDVPGALALVDVIVMNAVNVAVVHVVGVVLVRDGDMAAALAMSVVVACVRRVLSGSWHLVTPCLYFLLHSDINT